MKLLLIAAATALLFCSLGGTARAADVDCISTTFNLLSPNDKVCVSAFEAPQVSNVVCHISQARKGGWGQPFGLNEDPSNFSVACRQIGPIRFKDKVAQGDDMFRQRRSLFFKKMQIVRGCDVKRNVLVYMVYSDRLIEGSPKNSTSSVPIMPWGAADQVQRCGDFVEK